MFPCFRECSMKLQLVVTLLFFLWDLWEHNFLKGKRGRLPISDAFQSTNALTALYRHWFSCQTHWGGNEWVTNLTYFCHGEDECLHSRYLTMLFWKYGWCCFSTMDIICQYRGILTPLLKNRGIFREVMGAQVVHRVVFMTFFDRGKARHL